MFELKFGTPKPVPFRECWEMDGNSMDLNLEARFAVKVEVFDYDADRYASEEAVIAAIKSDGPAMLEKCLTEDWPENTPIVKKLFKGLDELLEKELERQGIKAHTEFISKMLTSDSENAYKNREMQFFPKRQGDLFGPDTIGPDEIKPVSVEGKYRLNLPSYIRTAEGRIFFAEGEEVEAEDIAVGSDTRYHFQVNAPDVEYEYGSTIKIKFKMPGHDVTITAGATPYGPPPGLVEKQLREWSLAGGASYIPSPGLGEEQLRQSKALIKGH